MRTVIVGGPKTGKTTLAGQLSSGMIPVFHTDDLIGKLDWGQDSAEVARWFDRPGPWIVEGVTTVRALRKWLKNTGTGAPCDEVYMLETPRQLLVPTQISLRKQIMGQFEEIADELAARNVTIHRT